MSLPFENIRVLDLTRVLAGPFCTMVLADLGAEVIKIEKPGEGDETRKWGPPFEGDFSAYFLCCNRNKKSVAVDIKSPAGLKLLLSLAAKSDVLVENFTPGTLERLGLGWETLHQINPKLIVCSITGFGQTGPYRDQPGYDILIQGFSGLMSITGEPAGTPMKVGVAVTDVTAGLYAAVAIASALFKRERTGRSERVDLALLDCAVALLANVGSQHLLTGKVSERFGNAHPSIVPYQVFETSDGYIIVAVGNDGQWKKFCKSVGQPGLSEDSLFKTNPLRVKNRTALLALLNPLLKQKNREAWLQIFRAHAVIAGPIQNLGEVFSDPQVLSRRMVRAAKGARGESAKLTGQPIKMSGADDMPFNFPPALGEHTGKVLREVLGLSRDEVASLIQTGACAGEA